MRASHPRVRAGPRGPRSPHRWRPCGVLGIDATNRGRSAPWHLARREGLARPPPIQTEHGGLGPPAASSTRQLGALSSCRRRRCTCSNRRSPRSDEPIERQPNRGPCRRAARVRRRAEGREGCVVEASPAFLPDPAARVERGGERKRQPARYDPERHRGRAPRRRSGNCGVRLQWSLRQDFLAHAQADTR